MELPWLPMLRQQLLGALDPWIRALSTHARFSLHGIPSTSSPDDSSSVQTLMVDIATDGEIDVQVFEALELLALLGGVDPQLFTVHMSSAAMRLSSWLRLPEATVLPIKCVLRIRHGDDFPTAITAWCERLVTGGIEGTASLAYTHVRMMLESSYKMLDMIDSPTRVKRDALVVPVEVQVSQGDFEERTAQLAHVAIAQHARDAMTARAFRHAHWKPIFRVTEVDPGIPRSISAKSFLYLSQIASCGIDVSRLWVYNMDVEPETAPVFTSGLQLLTGTQTDSERHGTLKEMELPEFMSEQTVSAVFSALMVSQSIKELTINHEAMPWQQDLPTNRIMTREERTHLWKWIALALFSRYAAHRLSTIRFHVQDLDENDIAAFRSSLHGPEAAMTGFSTSETDEIRPLETITASRFMLSAPLSLTLPGFGDIDFASQDVLAESDEGDPENRDWLRVVLPGCGRAWVHRSCITSRSIVQANRRTEFPSLTIAYMSERSKVAVLELLQLVGRDVHTLYVVNCSTREPLDEWLLNVVDVCPNLETLAVANGGSISSLDTFAKMYVRQACHVKCVRLNDVRIDHPESITQFIRLLGDDTLHLSKQLQKISLTAQSVGAALENIVPILDTVLSANVKLQDFHMLVSYQPHVSAASFSSVTALCQRHRDKPVAVRLAPLGLRQKVAFISTMGSDDQDNTTSRGTRDLDHRVLSLIFQFAAACKKRSVSLWFHTETNGDDDVEDFALAQIQGENQDQDQDDEPEDEGAGGGDNDRED